MRRIDGTGTGRAARWLLAALAATTACSGARVDVAGGGSTREVAPPLSSSAAAGPAESPRSVAADAGAPEARNPPGRTLLGEAEEVRLPITLEASRPGGSVVAIAQSADAQVGAFRRYDGKTGAFGPPIPLVGEWLYASFDAPDGGFATVTVRGEKLCVTTYAKEGFSAESRACASIAPKAVALVGDRLAMLETRPPGGAKATSKPASSPTKASKKPVKKASSKASKQRKKRPSEKPARAQASRAGVEVWLRFAALGGPIDDEAKPTDLAFERPLEGMEVIDAVGSATGIDVLFYESAPSKRGAGKTKRKPSSALGRAAIAAAHIGPDGKLDPKSRVTIAEDELQYGWVEEHKAPRLMWSQKGTLAVSLPDRGQGCEVSRLAPLLTTAAQTALCGVDPSRVSLESPVSEKTLGLLSAIAKESPLRSVAQRETDAERVAWAGDRGLYLSGGALRSASRVDGSTREEPFPFVAKRARIAWGAFTTSGEGLAFAGGRLQKVHEDGSIADRGTPSDHARTARAAALIGDSWWLARGDVFRASDGQVVKSLAGRAHHDTSALVGGPDRGLFLEVLGASFAVTALAPDGAATPLGNAISPVRAGLSAATRALGGAIVAGVSSADDARVVAFTVDESGRVGTAKPTTLPVEPGALGARLSPLPSGGAWLSDAARTRVIWLDDEANEIAAADWKAADSKAFCLDGEPGRAVFPSPAPGQLVAAPALASEGSCVVGDPVWSRDGTLRWFGSVVDGMDARAALTILPLREAISAPPRGPSAPLAGKAQATAVCPGDMVLVPGRFCVDRFESHLVDRARGEPVSPDYPSTPNLLDFSLGEGFTLRQSTGDVLARAMPLPTLGDWQRGASLATFAVSQRDVRPSGYVTGIVATSACEAAGKRLCTGEEFITACRGEADTQFPYGDDYEAGVCNVFRESHPAKTLHGNPSTGHLDPRLNRVIDGGGPLLQTTGGSPGCRSRFGSDAVYDMVGNVDEWIDEPGGAFAGGFYARSTRSGCDAIVESHPRAYLDYSTGIRCCRDLVTR